MSIYLQPCALVPWKYLGDTVNLGAIEDDYTSLRQNEGFEWTPIKLNNLKKKKFEAFVSQPDFQIKLHRAFREALITSSLSGCERSHIGSVVTTSDLHILATGHNQKPPYMDLPCDLLGCESGKFCRATYPAEAVIFGKLMEEFGGKGRPLPEELVIVSNTVPILEGINICEHNNVSMILFESYRTLIPRDCPVVSFKTIKSDIIFAKLSET